MIVSVASARGLAPLTVVRAPTRNIPTRNIPRTLTTFRRDILQTLSPASASILIGKEPLSQRRTTPSLIPPAAVQVRIFSSKGEDSKDGSPSQEESSTIRRMLGSVLTEKNQFYAVVAGGAIGAYGISRVFLSVTSFFTHLHPAFVAKWAFYTGFGTATLVGGLALVTADNLYIRADPVYRYCHDWVVNNSQVIAVLGDGLKAGSLRSYRLDAGKFELKEGVTSGPVWRPPRIQMIFDINASGPPYRTGLVTCEAVKSGGFPPKLRTTLLKVDYETGNEGEGGIQEEDKTLYLVGNEEDIQRVSTRSGLSLASLAREVHINRAAAGGK